MRHHLLSVVVVGVLIGSGIGLAGCGSGDDAPAADAAVAGPLTFRLSYDSDIPTDVIYVQSGTELGGQGWLTVRTAAGSDVAILDNCGLCNCDSCDPCAVCGAGLPEVTEIVRGTHLDWTWDARVFEPGTCATGGNVCERAKPLESGDYVARFCWSFTSDGVGTNHHVGPLACADEPFTVPGTGAPAAVVEHDLCTCG